MANIFDQPRNSGTLFLGGTKISGADIRDQNGKWCLKWSSMFTVLKLSDLVLATQAIANVVKSSFGPSGLDKMMVDDIGVSNTISKFVSCTKGKKDVTVTNDGATILSLLDIEHPAGKILVDLAQQQDREVRFRPPVPLPC